MKTHERESQDFHIDFYPILNNHLNYEAAEFVPSSRLWKNPTKIHFTHDREKLKLSIGVESN